jgi:hypothetical protein
MANLRLSNATRSVMANALDDSAINSGDAAATIKLYSGTQPATADTALSGNTLLATFTLDDPAFGSATNGVITLGGTPRTTTGAAAGTATFFRMESVGTGNIGTIMDGDVGTSGATLILNTTTISVGVDVSITAGTLTVPSGV